MKKNGWTLAREKADRQQIENQGTFLDYLTIVANREVKVDNAGNIYWESENDEDK